MTVRRAAFLTGLVATAVWIAAGAVLCESALRVPRRTPTFQSAELIIFAAQLQQVEITAEDGVVLRGSFLRGADSRDCVVLLHGIADSHGSALGFAPMFVQAGYSVLAPDSRAHGLSGGDFVTFGLLESADVLRWASWLHLQGCQRLFGLGESLGASILIQAAAREAVFSAIIAECPFRDLPSIAEHRVIRLLRGPRPLRVIMAKSAVSAALVYAYIRYRLDLTSASPVRSAKHLKTPLLVIHGLEDRNTPPAHSRAIAEANPEVLAWFVPGAGHTGASAREPVEFRMRVLEWFGPHRTPTPSP